MTHNIFCEDPNASFCFKDQEGSFGPVIFFSEDQDASLGLKRFSSEDQEASFGWKFFFFKSRGLVLPQIIVSKSQEASIGLT